MKEEQSGFEPILDEAEDPAIEFFNLSNKLNRMQRIFVWKVVNNPQMSYVECARKSGYKDARQSAYKLLKHPEVKKEINKHIILFYRDSYSTQHSHFLYEI